MFYQQDGLAISFCMGFHELRSWPCLGWVVNALQFLSKQNLPSESELQAVFPSGVQPNLFLEETSYQITDTSITEFLNMIVIKDK